MTGRHKKNIEIDRSRQKVIDRQESSRYDQKANTMVADKKQIPE